MNTIHIYLGISGDGLVSHTATTTPGHYAGHTVIGPGKLIEWFELHLGLSGIFPTMIERAIALKELIIDPKGDSFFFSKSFKSDPLGVAKRLLTLWDSWIFSGWDMQSSKQLPSRMATLAKLKDIFEQCGPGLAGRAKVVLQQLDMSSIPPVIIHLIDPPEYFPYIIQQLLSKVPECVRTDYHTLEPQASVNTDLWKLQTRLNSNNSATKPLLNDHTLQVIFFDNDIAEANAVYSLQLAANWKPLIISQDSSLLNGLHVSQNHPVSQWQTIAGNGQVSQLFFLATALFKRPANTSQIIAFLSAALTPFPKNLATSLVQVFSERPGFGNADWNEAINAYLTSISGDDTEKVSKKRIAFWLQNKAFLTEPDFSVPLLESIYNELGSWVVQATHYPYYSIYIDQLSNLSFLCAQLVKALKGEGEYVANSKFERIQSELFADVSSTIAEAEVGSADNFSSPSSVWSTYKQIVWMNAIRFEPTNHLTKYWYQEEKIYFLKHGLPLQDESHATSAYNFGLKRMVMSATERLVITVPSIAGGATAAKPYCLDEWNKLISLEPVTLDSGALLEKIPWNESTALLREHPTILLPEPVRYFSIEKEHFQREKESYSSIEKLIQHPAEWYMEYRLRLRHIAGVSAPNANIIKGVIADRVIQEMFKEENRKTKWWKTEASFLKKVEEVCDMILLQEGLPFLEKQTKRLLLEYKSALAHALGNLKSFIDENGVSIVATQFSVNGIIDGTPIEGYIDLLLKSPDKNIVIDLKWANSSRTYSEKLKTGSDLQLVLYAQIYGNNASSGYFMLNDGNAYMRNEKNNQGLLRVKYEEAADSIDTVEVYRRALNGLQYRRKELAAGNAEAGYDNPIEELNYFRQTADLGLYALKDRNEVKQAPYSDDLYLFFGKII